MCILQTGDNGMMDYDKLSDKEAREQFERTLADEIGGTWKVDEETKESVTVSESSSAPYAVASYVKTIATMPNYSLAGITGHSDGVVQITVVKVEL